MNSSAIQRKRGIARWLVISSLGLNAIVGLLAVRGTRLLNQSSEYVAATLRQQEAMNEVYALVADAETGNRGFLITGREPYLEPYNDAVQRLPSELDRLRTLLAREPDQLKMLVDVQPALQRKLDIMANRLVLLRNGQREEAIRDMLTDEGKRSMDEIRSGFNRMRAASTELLRQRELRAGRESVIANITSVALIAANALLIIVAVVAQRVQRWRQIITLRASDKAVLHEGRWVSVDRYLREQLDLCVSQVVSEEPASPREEKAADLARRS